MRASLPRVLLALLLLGPALAADFLLFVLLRKLPEPPQPGRYRLWKYGFYPLVYLTFSTLKGQRFLVH